MLIKVFGVWLLSTNITYLNPRVETGCVVNFVNATQNSNYIHMKDHECEAIAAEVNKQMQR